MNLCLYNITLFQLALCYLCWHFHCLYGNKVVKSFPISNGTFEPRHDKSNKMSVHPAKTQISLGIRSVWSESSLCAQWVAKGPKCSSCGQRRLWSDMANAQTDLSLRWEHSHFVGFVMSRLIYEMHTIPLRLSSCIPFSQEPQENIIFQPRFQIPRICSRQHSMSKLIKVFLNCFLL